MDSLFSRSWYRVKDLRPSLVVHARIRPQTFRGQLWYVAHDPTTGAFLRFSPEVRMIVGWMDGERSCGEIWSRAAEELGDESPTQTEFISVLARLHHADLLSFDTSPDALEQSERGRAAARRERRSRMSSPLSLRFKLADPERLLASTAAWVTPFFARFGWPLWLVTVLPALLLAGVNWAPLTEGIVDEVFAVTNFPLILASFVVLKLFHELGHGYVAHAYGGEVHDMGIMFLVFAPVPYVDATSAWGFSRKQERIAVSMAGMVVEIFLAAVAFHVWLYSEPGAVRAVARNVLVIGGATTLLFNANPLLRYDGYYVLSDWLEIPNLRTRASGMMRFLFDRYLFGRPNAEVPPGDRSERAWLVSYAIASFAYRMVVLVFIVTWIVDQNLLVGVVLGLFAAVGWFGLPLYKAGQRIFQGPELREVRARAVFASVGLLLVLGLLLAVVPMPLRTMAEGVVWLPADAVVRAETDGFIVDVSLRPGQQVGPGDVVATLDNDELAGEIRSLEARVDELESSRMSARVRGALAEDKMLLEEISVVQEELARRLVDRENLEVAIQSAGVFVAPRLSDLPGRFVARGQVLGHVIEMDRLRVRALVSDEDIQLVTKRLRNAEVRLAETPGQSFGAVVKRITPAASDELPSRALGHLGGGQVAVDPSSEGAALSIEEMFAVDLEISDALPTARVGGRVHIRFDLGHEPLILQAWRRVQQVFLRVLHV